MLDIDLRLISVIINIDGGST